MVKLLKKILNNKKGMSLMEVITGMVIFSVISLTAAAIISSAIRVSINANDIAETNLLLDTISDYIMYDINNAKQIEIDADEIKLKMGTNTIVYSADGNGRLNKTVNNIPAVTHDEGYYKRKTLLMEFYDVNDKQIGTGAGLKNPSVFTFRLTLISSNGNVISARDYTVRPLGYIM